MPPGQESAGGSAPPAGVRFFADVGELRDWFSSHHDRLEEQWIGYFKKASGIPSIDWPGSVDVALCFGWIDGLRRRIDDRRYMIRFTPRRPRSSWSERNVQRMRALLRDGLVAEAGRAAFRARTTAGTDGPSGLPQPTALPQAMEAELRADPAAWQHFRDSRPSYRHQVVRWILAAKREATRQRRLRQLIQAAAQGQPVPPLRWSSGTRKRVPGGARASGRPRGPA